MTLPASLFLLKTFTN